MCVCVCVYTECMSSMYSLNMINVLEMDHYSGTLLGTYEHLM